MSEIDDIHYHLKNIFEIGKSEKYKKSLQQNVSERKKRLKNKLKSKTNDEISKAAGKFSIPGFKWPL